MWVLDNGHRAWSLCDHMVAHTSHDYPVFGTNIITNTKYTHQKNYTICAFHNLRVIKMYRCQIFANIFFFGLSEKITAWSFNIRQRIKLAVHQHSAFLMIMQPIYIFISKVNPIENYIIYLINKRSFYYFWLFIFLLH